MFFMPQPMLVIHSTGADYRKCANNQGHDKNVFKLVTVLSHP